jgi:predicted ester cyclase
MQERAENDERSQGKRRNRSTNVQGEVLRSQRLAHAWTQQELAQAAGLSERLIRLAERGGPIEMKSVRALASALSVPSEAILGDDAEPATGPSMGAKARRFLQQIWNHGNLDVINELLLPEFRFHHERGVVSNREEMRQRIEDFRRSFSDFDFVVEGTVDHGTFIVCRWRVAMTHNGAWLSLPATGRRVTVHGSSWVQVVDGKFGDAWDFWDPEKLYRELAS